MILSRLTCSARFWVGGKSWWYSQCMESKALHPMPLLSCTLSLVEALEFQSWVRYCHMDCSSPLYNLKYSFSRVACFVSASILLLLSSSESWKRCARLGRISQSSQRGLCGSLIRRLLRRTIFLDNWYATTLEVPQTSWEYLEYETRATYRILTLVRCSFDIKLEHLVYCFKACTDLDLNRRLSNVNQDGMISLDSNYHGQARRTDIQLHVQQCIISYQPSRWDSNWTLKILQ